MRLLRKSVKVSLLMIWIGFLIVALLYGALIAVIAMAIGYPDSPLAIQGYIYIVGAMTCLTITLLALGRGEVEA
ncbi:MAG: hypothetical protein WA972_05895 [Rhodococcus qingshengii]